MGKELVITMKSKISVGLVFALLTILISGCGKSISDSISEKVSEQVTESIINSQSEDGTEVDIDGETVVFKTEEGEEVSFGSTEWPDGDLMNQVPKYKDGNVSYVMESEDYILLTVEETSLDGYEDYKEELMDSGFTENSTEMNSTDSYYYGAANSSGIMITISFTTSDNVLSLQVFPSTE